MVIQEKNTQKIWICIDLRSVNASCVHDPFPITFTDELLENVGGREAYSFTDGFSRHFEVRIVEEDQTKNTFTIKWGSFSYTIMPFILKNAPLVFSQIVVATRKESIHNFMEVYLDNWTFFNLLKYYIQALYLILDRCHQLQISLNLKKYIFCTPFGIVLGNVMCKDTFLVDMTKIVSILYMIDLLVVEPDYLPDSEVLAFSRVYTPWSIYTPEVCTLFHTGECRGGVPPLRGPGAKPPKQKLPCKSIL